MPNKFLKDPNAILDYTVDWSDWLDTDTIATSTWVLPSELTNVSDAKTGTTSTVFLSGGTLGKTHQVVNRITTVLGRTDDRTIKIRIVEK